MDRDSLNVLNAAVLIAILAVLFFGWFFMKEQFAWAIVLIVAILLFACYVNITRKFPWHRLDLADAILAVAILFILAFVWFYMQYQICWAVYLIVFLLVLVEIVRLRQWLKDTVSIQINIKRKGDGGDPGEPGEPRKPADKN